MRCPVCETENAASAARCESCDQDFDALDAPAAVEKYRRAFDKLAADGSLNERGAQQCKKLRAKLKISEEIHERFLSELTSEEAEEDLEISLALSWSSGHLAEVAVIHRGDFTFDQLEVSLLSTFQKGMVRERMTDLDPDERHLFEAPLFDPNDPPSSLLSLAVQLQIRTIDITEEVRCYRSPFLSLSSGEVELVDLYGKEADSLFDLIERRSLFSLLGSEGWRELPLHSISEDELFEWEVKASAKRDWLRRAASDGWRVGDQASCKLGELTFKERLCPGGISWIGAPLGVGRDWETPAHQVKISGPIWCAETPVTQALWTEVMGDNPSDFMEEECPVHSISWYDAIHFCNRLSRRLGLSLVYTIQEDGRVSRDASASGYRLPSEVDWEHLARGGLERAYAGSNRAEQVCWSLEISDHRPQAVAQKSPNAWGLFDQCGNVWEWCEDYFIEDVYRRRGHLISDPRVQFPPQLEGEPSRVRRGGSWATAVDACRVFSRADGLPTWKSPFVGLRVVRLEKSGVAPSDRRVSATEASWAHLQRGPVFLATVIGSPRREWAIRLESLGVHLTEEEERASVVIVIPPKSLRPKKALWDQLDHFRRRAHGLGSLVLETHQAAELLSEREVNVHRIEEGGARWTELYGKRVFVIGRFRLTQNGLKEKLKAKGVLVTMNPDKAELLIMGGGKLAAKHQLSFSARDLPILNEVECLAILDAQTAIPLG